MTTDEIRRTFTEFFVARDHLRLPSSSLVPAEHDPSALFTIAGMHPLKPYFQGIERPAAPAADQLPEDVPHGRHRDHRHDHAAPDVLRDARQLLARRLLQARGGRVRVGAVARGLRLQPPTTSGSRCSPATTSSDSAPTRRRSRRGWRSASRASGSSSARARRTSGRPGRPGRAGRARSCTSTAASTTASPTTCPAATTSASWSTGTSCSCSSTRTRSTCSTPLPAKNIDTGLGLNRMASILQGKPTVFETDQFAPLIELGEELSGRRYGEEFATDQALRVLADHGRAMTFLIADGVVPSNEDRGYVLRRIMRRAILQGRHALGLDPGFLHRYAGRVTELMGSDVPRAARAARAGQQVAATPRRRASGARSSRARSCSTTDRARPGRRRGGDLRRRRVPAARHLRLPVRPDARDRRRARPRRRRGRASRTLMEEQRERARAAPAGTRSRQATARAGARRSPAAPASPPSSSATRRPTRDTTSGRSARTTARCWSSSSSRRSTPPAAARSPTPAYVECADGDCRATVVDVLRLGDDQVVAVEPEHGELEPGERVHAHVDRARAPRHRVQPHRHAPAARRAAAAARHARPPGRLLRRPRQAALRLHPRQRAERRGAGRRSRTRSTRWILESQPVRALTTTLDEAKRARRDGAVRREVRRRRADGRGRRRLVLARAVRRHPRAHHAEIGLFKIAVGDLERGQRAPDRGASPAPRRSSCCARTTASWRESRRAAARAARAGARARSPSCATALRELERAARQGGGRQRRVDVDALVSEADERDGVRVLTRRGPGARRQGAARRRRPAQGQARRRRDRARQRRRGPRRPGRQRRPGAGRARRARGRDRQGGGRGGRRRRGRTRHAGARRRPRPRQAARRDRGRARRSTRRIERRRLRRRPSR